MADSNKAYFAISLARKAGKLIVGFDAVAEAALKGEAMLVMFAADTSAGTMKRMRGICEGLCEMRTVPHTQSELSNITRKAAGVLAVTDEDLAVLCLQALPEEEEQA